MARSCTRPAVTDGIFDDVQFWQRTAFSHRYLQRIRSDQSERYFNRIGTSQVSWTNATFALILSNRSTLIRTQCDACCSELNGVNWGLAWVLIDLEHAVVRWQPFRVPRGDVAWCRRIVFIFRLYTDFPLNPQTTTRRDRRLSLSVNCMKSCLHASCSFRSWLCRSADVWPTAAIKRAETIDSPLWNLCIWSFMESCFHSILDLSFFSLNGLHVHIIVNTTNTINESDKFCLKTSVSDKSRRTAVFARVCATSRRSSDETAAALRLLGRTRRKTNNRSTFG